jgi:hypothetical protein
VSVVIAVIVQAVPPIVSRSTAALSYRRPYSAGLSRDRVNGDRVHDNRDTCVTIHSRSTSIFPITSTPSSEGRTLPHAVCPKI